MGRLAHNPRCLAAITLFALAVTARAADPTPANKDAAEQRIADIETHAGGRLGVAALDTGSNRRIEHRAGERFPMCSTFKLLAVAAVLHRVDQKQENLARFVRYTAADLLEYAPVTKEHVSEGGMILSALCAAALNYSDNTSANLLLKTIDGPAGFTRYARSLGDKRTRLDRLEPQLNSAIPGDERDTTTPAAMLGDLHTLLLDDALSIQSRAQLDAWLTDNKTGDEMIRAGLPKDWQVGDKTGRGAHGTTNDIAIIRPPGKAPILLTIYFTDSPLPQKARLAVMADVARVVAETL